MNQPAIQREPAGAREDLEARIVELEVRLAFQEHALVELGDALAASRIETDRHAEQLRRALEELSRGSGDAADPAQEPPPPHY